VLVTLAMIRDVKTVDRHHQDLGVGKMWCLHCGTEYLAFWYDENINIHDEEISWVDDGNG